MEGGKSTVLSNENVYYRARKEAAKRDERFASREMAADILGVSLYTLADYENGNTKVVPVDKVVLMADFYHAPELKTQYCKSECPIGKNLPLATEQKGLEGIALRLVSSLARVEELQKEIIQISEDGKVSPDEEDSLDGILTQLDHLSEVISEMKLFAEKAKTKK